MKNKTCIYILKEAVQTVIEIAVIAVCCVLLILLCILVWVIYIVWLLADCIIRTLEKGKCL